MRQVYVGRLRGSGRLTAFSSGPFTQLPNIGIPAHVGSEMAWTSDEQGRAYAMYTTGGPAAANGFDLGWRVGRSGRGAMPPYWAAGSPCNCFLGGSARVYTTKQLMGNWSYLTDINPPLVPRPPLPPPGKRCAGSNPPPTLADAAGAQRHRQQCQWVGGVYIASGGQPLRAELRISQLPDGRYNFSQGQADTRSCSRRAASISITESVGRGVKGDTRGCRSMARAEQQQRRLLQPHHLARWGLHVGARAGCAGDSVPRCEPDVRRLFFFFFFFFWDEIAPRTQRL